ncbi:Uncharacterised protein [Salmonella enterica subsp. enterica]|nr:Uncharacterised protein [Salmonella enterica subsp. enterica] [Salmonella enterica subsp. enterica serovar Florida]
MFSFSLCPRDKAFLYSKDTMTGGGLLLFGMQGVIDYRLI